jgi:hypothetical protein
MGNWLSSDEELRNTIAEQKKEIQDLKQAVSQLQSPSMAITPKLPNVSREKIMAWVDKQLDDPDNNIGFMPDSIERKFKAQIFGMVLNMFDYMLETTKIEFMGHEIKFNLSAASSHD